MTGRRSHGRLSALNGVVHQGSYILQAVSESLDQFILDYLHVNEDAC